VSVDGGKFQRRNGNCQVFIPTIFGDKVMPRMKSSTPRLAGIRLRLAEGILRGPLPRLMSRLVVDRKLREIDFAAEGEPAPLYMPQHYVRKHRP
jgi:hypothetical protein